MNLQQKIYDLPEPLKIVLTFIVFRVAELTCCYIWTGHLSW